MTKMTSMERRELQGLIRQKARLMKAQAAQRGRELIAEFEQQLNSHFNYDQDEVWKEAFEEAERRRVRENSSGPRERRKRDA